MARPLKYPLSDLTPDNRFMVLAGDSDLRQKAARYAKRHGFRVTVEEAGKGEDGRQLFHVQRHEVA